MKKFKYILTALLMIVIFSVKAQRRDTIVFVVDKNLDIVEFFTEKRFCETESFVIAVDCNYYGEDDNLAEAVLEEIREDFNLIIEVKKSRIKIAKSTLSNYETLNVTWLSKQKSLYDIRTKVGYYNYNKCYYVVFEGDLNDLSRDSVVMYQSILGFSEFED